MSTTTDPPPLSLRLGAKGSALLHAWTRAELVIGRPSSAEDAPRVVAHVTINGGAAQPVELRPIASGDRLEGTFLLPFLFAPAEVSVTCGADATSTRILSGWWSVLVVAVALAVFAVAWWMLRPLMETNTAKLLVAAATLINLVPGAIKTLFSGERLGLAFLGLRWRGLFLVIAGAAVALASTHVASSKLFVRVDNRALELPLGLPGVPEHARARGKSLLECGFDCAATVSALHELARLRPGTCVQGESLDVEDTWCEATPPAGAEAGPPTIHIRCGRRRWPELELESIVDPKQRDMLDCAGRACLPHASDDCRPVEAVVDVRIASACGGRPGTQRLTWNGTAEAPAIECGGGEPTKPILVTASSGPTQLPARRLGEDELVLSDPCGGSSACRVTLDAPAPAGQRRVVELECAGGTKQLRKIGHVVEVLSDSRNIERLELLSGEVVSSRTWSETGLDALWICEAEALPTELELRIVVSSLAATRLRLELPFASLRVAVSQGPQYGPLTCGGPAQRVVGFGRAGGDLSDGMVTLTGGDATSTFPVEDGMLAVCYAEGTRELSVERRDRAIGRLALPDLRYTPTPIRTPAPSPCYYVVPPGGGAERIHDTQGMRCVHNRAFEGEVHEHLQQCRGRKVLRCRAN